MTSDQEERFISAFERMAEAFDFMAGSVAAISKTLEKDHHRSFPTKKPPKEATITHILTEEERLREDQGASDEPIEKWANLGEREKAYLRDHPEEADFYPTGPEIDAEDED